jgi:glycosyltransferase involved in cell wall biosynthesis
MNRGVSVVICCYNSSMRLPVTLQKIARLDTHGIAVEVIVVDNGSTDRTGEIAHAEWARQNRPFPLQVELEREPGLAAARSKGLAVSNFEYVIFCDDDNWLDNQYARRAIALMEQNPQVAIIGGINEAACETPPPEWFLLLSDAYAVGRQGATSGEVWAVWGAGMVLRKSVLQRLERAGFQALLSDRKGSSLSSGGDFELCQAIKLAGFKVWYDEGLKLQHFMTSGRLTEAYIRRLFHSTAYCMLGLQPYMSAFERNLRSETEVTRTIFLRKAARLGWQVAGDFIRFRPLVALLRKDLPFRLNFRRRLLTIWIYLTRTGELVENTRRVVALRLRLTPVPTFARTHSP